MLCSRCGNNNAQFIAPYLEFDKDFEIKFLKLCRDCYGIYTEFLDWSLDKFMEVD